MSERGGKVRGRRSGTSRSALPRPFTSSHLELRTFSADLEFKQRVTVTFVRSSKIRFRIYFVLCRLFLCTNQSRRVGTFFGLLVDSVTAVKETAPGPVPSCIFVLEGRSPLPPPIRQQCAYFQERTSHALHSPQSLERSFFPSPLVI